MAPSSHANVKNPDTSRESELGTVDAMTLVEASSAAKLPVYLASRRFSLTMIPCGTLLTMLPYTDPSRSR